MIVSEHEKYDTVFVYLNARVLWRGDSWAISGSGLRWRRRRILLLSPGTGLFSNRIRALFQAAIHALCRCLLPSSALHPNHENVFIAGDEYVFLGGSFFSLSGRDRVSVQGGSRHRRRHRKPALLLQVMPKSMEVMHGVLLVDIVYLMFLRMGVVADLQAGAIKNMALDLIISRPWIARLFSLLHNSYSVVGY